MSAILTLKTEDAKRLNPHALKRFNDWQDRILNKVPQLRQLGIEQIRADLNIYLYDNERIEFNKCVADITRWLSGCMDTGDDHFLYPYDTRVIDPMSRVESLIIGAYQRAEAERRKKEYNDSWRAAFISIKPPVDDAKKYLNSKEHDEFILAMGKAIDAYLEKGVAYMADLRTLDYGWWSKKIQERKMEKAKKLQAIRAANEYNHRLNQEIAKLTSRLDHKQEDLASYLRVTIQDKRYTNHNFDYVLSKDDKTNFDGTLVSMANKKLEQLLSNDLRYFISLPSQYYRLYFPLPIANYSFEKVPCIDISFDIFAAAYAEVWLKPGIKEFNGYKFDLPLMEERNYLVLLEKPRFLAYHYLILSPEDLGGLFWESIPLGLLMGLLNGEARPDGCTILAAWDSGTTYRVKGFEEDVDVPDKFAEYLKSIGSIDKMVDMGVMTEKVGNIVKAELGDLEVKRKIQPVRKKAGRRDSMKESVFGLFDEGRRPGDPEVKALDIKPNTVYRYYQDWKKS